MAGIENLFYIWNAENGGWLTINNAFSSDIANANPTTWAVVETLCANAYNPVTKDFKLIPVSAASIAQVLDRIP